jgi:hypothetical protein
MKPRRLQPGFLVLIAMYALTFALNALRTHAGNIDDPKPIIAYEITAGFWPASEEFSPTRLVLYDNDEIIFKRRNSSDAAELWCVSLSPLQKAHFLKNMEGLKKAKSDYSISGASDQPKMIIWRRTKTADKAVRVYGVFGPGNYHPTPFVDATELPPGVFEAFRTVVEFDAQNARPWHPQFMEVTFVSIPPEYVKEKKGVDWPVNWPCIHDASSVYAPYISGDDCWKIRLPFEKLPELRALYKESRKSEGGLIRMDGKLWQIHWYYPLPHEDMWEKRMYR